MRTPGRAGSHSGTDRTEGPAGDPLQNGIAGRVFAMQAAAQQVHRPAGKDQHGPGPTGHCVDHRIQRAVTGKHDELRNPGGFQIAARGKLLRGKFDGSRHT